MIRKKGIKKIQSCKETVDGIVFLSTLEATMYKLLKKEGIFVTYEGNSYNLLNSFKYKGECYERVRKKSKEMVNKQSVRGITYTPDFIGRNEEFFIEVKTIPNESFPLRWKLFKSMLEAKGQSPMIFKPMNIKDCEQVVQILKSKGYGKKR